MIGTAGAPRRAGALASMIGLMGVLAGLGACHDSEDLTPPIAIGVVTVFQDPGFDFATLHTFAMPDTVVHLTQLTRTPLNVSRQFDHVALDQVRQDLLSRGYTEVVNPQTIQPDFVVLVGVTATVGYNAFVGYSWFSFWGFYSGWGWFAPGFNTSWGILYPWFTAVGATAFNRGTLIVDLIPTSSVDANARTIRSAWAGVSAGLIDGSTTSITVSAAIDKMFQLSPYLTASNP